MNPVPASDRRPPAEGLELRPLSGLAEFQAAIALQEQTWGHGFSERVPVSILKVAQHTGGVASGAFDLDGSLVGFVFGITGVRDGRAMHWSDMLAVRPDRRGEGIGRALKLHQRDQLQARGIDTMYWTADPLESRNAHLNLNVLGARAVEYHIDFYGRSESPLHGGLPTDRLLMRWQWGPEPGTRDARSSSPVSSPTPDLALADLPILLDRVERPGSDVPEPRVGESSSRAVPARIALPDRLAILMAQHPETALQWRHAVRQVLEPLLTSGRAQVTGLRRESITPQRSVHWLVVSPPVEPSHPSPSIDDATS